MKQKLFQQSFHLDQSSHQAHLVYRVYVPEEIEAIEIRFNYQPIAVKDKTVIAQSFLREGLPLTSIDDETVLRNLLTVSVNDPLMYRGAHHCFMEEQMIQIGEDHTSEGFLKGKIAEGYWEFIINCHGVFSKEIDGQITIFGMSERNKIKEPAAPLEIAGGNPKQKQRPFDGKRNFHLKKAELHAHTVHSDGQQTTEELLAQAETAEIDWLAMTDHNTYTALIEAKEQQSAESKVKLLHGIEYTTYYGHFLVHGDLNHILKDWTKISKNNLSAFLEELKENDVYITIAHPFDTGNPFCTGCRWEYMLHNLEHADAIEVWNGTNPHQSLSNEDAFRKWTQLLAEGHEIAAACGRDWHGPSDEEIAYTYLLLPPDETEKDVLHALNLGRSYCSIRPQIDFRINESYIIGDRLENRSNELTASLLLTNVRAGDTVQIYSDRGLVYEKIISGGDTQQKEIQLINQDYSLLRVEIHNSEKERIAFTNPIYINS